MMDGDAGVLTIQVATSSDHDDDGSRFHSPQVLSTSQANPLWYDLPEGSLVVGTASMMIGTPNKDDQVSAN
jgi:hypothetical protein